MKIPFVIFGFVVSLFLMDIAYGQEELTQDDTRNPFLTQQEQIQGFSKVLPSITESKDDVSKSFFLLQAIFVRGENFTALINGQVMHEGSEIEGFIVRSIDKDTVLLMSSNGKEIVLRLPSPQKTETYDKN